MPYVCPNCGDVDVVYVPGEEPDDDWYSYLVTMSVEVPSRERCEGWLDEKGISDEIALDTARDMHNKLRWEPKMQRWNPGGYLTIYATWQSWCRNAFRRNGHQPSSARSLITKQRY